MKRTLITILATLLLAGVAFMVLRTRSLSESQASVPPAFNGEGAEVSRTTVPDTSPVPVLVRKLSEPALHLEDRIQAVRALPSDLSEKESNSLMDLLREPAPAGINSGDWYVMQNEIMEVMRQPRFAWNGFGSAMEALVVDRHVDPVVRDYAAQHLTLYLAGEPKEGSLSDGMNAFLTVLRGEREAHEDVAGTTLMALCDLHSQRPPAELAPYKEELGKIITSYADGSISASLPNWIAAIQSAGRLDVQAALPAIRRYVMEKAPNASVKLSSVAALGYYGDAADLPFLNELAASNDKLRFAAQAALDNHARRN